LDTSILDICLQSTHTIISGLHDFTHLPWALSLPLTAILVRLVIATPLQWYVHHHVQRGLDILPLVHAWRYPIQRKVLAEHNHRGEAYCVKLANQEVKKKQSEIFKRFGLRRTAVLAPILQLPVWLLFVETIRRMCGTHEGLLGLVVKPFTSSIPTDTAVDAPIVESVAVPLEVSMGYEGALWFPDLLVPDPMLILPCVLSAALFANVSYNERRTIEGQGDLRSKFNIRITRILKTIALAALPLTLQLPSAMLVYWISSSVAALGQSFLFDRFLPYESIKPCKPEPRPF
jgi:inner membrane protein COX18